MLNSELNDKIRDVVAGSSGFSAVLDFGENFSIIGVATLLAKTYEKFVATYSIVVTPIEHFFLRVIAYIDRSMFNNAENRAMMNLVYENLAGILELAKVLTQNIITEPV